MVVRRKEDLENMLAGWCGRTECASKVEYDRLCVLWVSERAGCAARWVGRSSCVEAVERGN